MDEKQNHEEQQLTLIGTNAAKEEEIKFSWGYFNCRPRVCKVFNSAKFLLFALSFYYFSNSLVINGVYSSIIPTVERRFALTSAQMGMVTSIYDIAAFIFVLPVSYFGVRSRPRSLACGMLTMALGFLIFIFPHFLIAKYEPVIGKGVSNSSLTSVLCTIEEKPSATPCLASYKASSNVPYSFFLLAMFIAGAGCTPMLAIGVPYLDDSVNENVSPVYVSIFCVFGVIGIGAGSLLASFSLKLFVHPTMSIFLKPGDSQWVGAWWLGFVVGIALAIFSAIALAALPRKIAREDFLHGNDAKSELIKNQLNLPASQFLHYLKKLVFEYKSFLFISIWISLEMFNLSGIVAFLPKVSSVQLGIPSRLTAVYAGIPSMISGIVGSLGGGLVLKKGKFSSRGTIKLCLFFSTLSTITGFAFFLTCEPFKYVNGTNSITTMRQATGINSTCYASCNCLSSTFLPVCGDQGTYISPCTAGCSYRQSTRAFSKCLCELNTTVTLGPCKARCGYKAPLYFILVFVFSTFLSISIIPGAIATLRSVPYNLKTFGVGFQWALVRVLGAIPGPIIFGYLIDTACKRWQFKCTNNRGNCQLYNNFDMSIKLGICVLLVKLLGTGSLLLALWCFKDPNINENEEKKEMTCSTDT